MTKWWRRMEANNGGEEIENAYEETQEKEKVIKLRL